MAGTVLQVIDWPIEAVGVVVGAAIWERRGKDLEVQYGIERTLGTMGWDSKVHYVLSWTLLEKSHVVEGSGISFCSSAPPLPKFIQYDTRDNMHF